MKGYPVVLQLLGQKVVVIGGGRIATRKVATLLETEADITVVSPDVTERLTRWVEEGRITWRQKSFHIRDLVDAFIVIAATNDKELNQLIAMHCHQHQLVNVVSDGKAGNFIVPASFTRGTIKVSVTTNGTNPSLAKQIRDEIASAFDEAYEAYSDLNKD